MGGWCSTPQPVFALPRVLVPLLGGGKWAKNPRNGGGGWTTKNARNTTGLQAKWFGMARRVGCFGSTKATVAGVRFDCTSWPLAAISIFRHDTLCNERLILEGVIWASGTPFGHSLRTRCREAQTLRPGITHPALLKKKTGQ